MGLYSRYIFPRLCELLLDRPFVAARRKQLLDAARGDVLEIGIGTGLNLPHYPAHVKKITAIDPNPGMHRKAEARIATCGVEVDKRDACRLLRQRAARHRLAVAFREVLCDLVDDVGLALRSKAQMRESRANFAVPVMHVDLR